MISLKENALFEEFYKEVVMSKEVALCVRQFCAGLGLNGYEEGDLKERLRVNLRGRYYYPTDSILGKKPVLVLDPYQGLHLLFCKNLQINEANSSKNAGTSKTKSRNNTPARKSPSWREVGGIAFHQLQEKITDLFNSAKNQDFLSFSLWFQIGIQAPVMSLIPGDMQVPGSSLLIAQSARDQVIKYTHCYSQKVFQNVLGQNPSYVMGGTVFPLKTSFDGSQELYFIIKNGRIQFAGGGADGEDVEAAAIREAYEELGFRVKSDSCLGGLRFDNHGLAPALNFLYLCRVEERASGVSAKTDTDGGKITSRCRVFLTGKNGLINHPTLQSFLSGKKSLEDVRIYLKRDPGLGDVALMSPLTKEEEGVFSRSQGPFYLSADGSQIDSEQIGSNPTSGQDYHTKFTPPNILFFDSKGKNIELSKEQIGSPHFWKRVKNIKEGKTLSIEVEPGKGSLDLVPMSVFKLSKDFLEALRVYHLGVRIKQTFDSGFMKSFFPVITGSGKREKKISFEDDLIGKRIENRSGLFSVIGAALRLFVLLGLLFLGVFSGAFLQRKNPNLLPI